MELKPLDKIQVWSTAWHIDHHNKMVDAINQLQSLYMAIVEKMKEQCDGIDELGGNMTKIITDQRSSIDSINWLEDKLSEQNSLIESITQPKVPSFAHTRVTNKTFVSWSEEILLIQHKVDSFGTYIIDTKAYVVNADENCRSSGVDPMRIIDIRKEEDMVVESRLLIESHDKTTTEVSYDIEVFIYRISE